MARNLDLLSALSGATFDPSRSVLDRRRLLGWATGMGAAAVAAQVGLSTHPVAAAQNALSDHTIRHTWLLESADALRPEAPTAPTAAEIEELIDVQASRTDEMAATAAHWGGVQGVLAWDDLGLQLSAEFNPPGFPDARATALVRVAINDAVMAALDAQAAYPRAAPSVTDDRITPLGSGSSTQSSFPSIHAAVAGAAATVLADLYPDAQPDQFAGMADEAATSGLWAGTNYRSDVEAGLALGRAVGALAVEHGRTDGSAAEWDGSGRLTGDGYYEPTPPNFVDPPFAPLAGTWATWALPSGDVFRPAPFPDYGSLAWHAELQTVRDATARRTLEQERIIDFWLSIGPNVYYSRFAKDMIQRQALGEGDAAHVLAMIGVAMYDALVAVWDAKYHYWIARPLTMDPDLNMYIPNPPYPSYPAGFPAGCGAGAAVLTHLFPESEAELMASAVEGAAQRGWSGIHYVLDDDVGLLMGAQVGRLVAEVARAGAAEIGD